MINIRLVEVRGNTYLRKEDVVSFIRELAATEETDVRNRLNEAADRLNGPRPTYDSVAAEWVGKDVASTTNPQIKGIVVEVYETGSQLYQARIIDHDFDGHRTEYNCLISDLEKVYTNPLHLKFVDECRKAGFKVRPYAGRNFYKGPAVLHEDYQEVIRKVTMPLVWDRMGKSDFIIYPK